MSKSYDPNIKSNKRPLIFILKENKKVRKKPHDYSLMMLHTTTNEVIYSPLKAGKKQFPLIPKLSKKKQSLSFIPLFEEE